MKLSLPNGLNLKYGILDELYFSTIGEAFRSLYSQLPAFYEEVKHQLFIIKINGKAIENELFLEVPLKEGDHVELIVSVEGSGGGAKIIIGAVIAVAGIALTFTPFVPLSGALIKAGLGLALAGAAEMFAPKPPDTAEAAKNNLFQGQVSGIAEGAYLGIPVGMAKVTGHIIDQEIKKGNKQKDEIMLDSFFPPQFSEYTTNVGEAFNRYNVTFALGLGEIAGVNGRVTSNDIVKDDIRKHVYFDDTPIMEKGGSLNYKIATNWRNGQKSQSVIQAAGWYEESFDANIELGENDETAHAVLDSDVDELEAIVQIPQLYWTSSKGKISTNNVFLVFYQSIDGKAYTFLENVRIRDKEFSPFEIKFLFKKPENVQKSWSIKVRRINHVDTEAGRQNKASLKRWIERKKEKYQHPYKVLVNLDFDSRDISSNAHISFEIAGAKMRIPSNYDPYKKLYSGLWNGSFKWDWSNSPPWVLLHYLTAPLAAGGCARPFSEFDLNSFYEAAKYCDQRVSDGRGGSEPRYALNGIIPGGMKAAEVIKLICSHFQGNLLLMNGQYFLDVDRPSQAKYLLTNANVIDGFNYGSTSLKGQPNEIKVTYVDAEKNYEKSYHTMVDKDLLAMQGSKITTEFELPLCQSGGMAQRLALFNFETNKSQVETLTYKASIAHLVAGGIGVMPGDVIHISDDFMIGHRYDGQFKKIEGKKISLDCEVFFEDSEDYKLEFINGANHRQIVHIDMVATGAGLKSVIYTKTPVSAVKGGIWVLVSASLAPKPYKVIAIKQDEDDIVEVACIAHEPNKYARIEQGVNLPDKSYDNFITGAIKKPYNINQKARLYKNETGTDGEIAFSFTEANDPRIKYYQAQVNRPDSGWQNLTLTGLNQGRIDKVLDGVYSIRVRAVADNGRASGWETKSFKVNIWSPLPQNVQDFRATIQQDNILLQWRDVSDLDLDKYIICYSPIKGAYWVEAGEIAQIKSNTITLPLRSGTYLVKAQDLSGGRSKLAAMVVVDGIIAKDENIIHKWSESEAGWKGAKEGLFPLQNRLFLAADNNIFDWSALRKVEDILEPCVNKGTYSFAKIIDLIEPMDVSLSAFVDARGRDLNDDIYEWADIKVVKNIFPYSDGSYGAELQMRYSQDGKEWSDWQNLIYQKVKARFFAFKAILWTEDIGYSPEIRDIRVVMDLPEYVQDGKDIIIPKGGKRISFNKAFWKLTSLTPTAEKMTEGMNYQVTQKNNEGFFIAFFNKNQQPIAAQIDYQAMGIGLKG